MLKSSLHGVCVYIRASWHQVSPDPASVFFTMQFHIANYHECALPIFRLLKSKTLKKMDNNFQLTDITHRDHAYIKSNLYPQGIDLDFFYFLIRKHSSTDLY